MKYVTTTILSAQSHDDKFCHEDLWESKHVLDPMRCTHPILDAHYEKSELRKISSNKKKLPDDERDALHDILSKY